MLTPVTSEETLGKCVLISMLTLVIHGRVLVDT